MVTRFLAQNLRCNSPNMPIPPQLDRVWRNCVLPPLVTSWEILSCVSSSPKPRRAAFVLQGGDCAERFIDCTPIRITNTLKVLLQMSLVLVIGAAGR